MGFATFVSFQVFNALNTRSDDRSVFTRDSLRTRWRGSALAVVLALQVAVIHLGPLQRLFDTTSLSAGQWAVRTAVASSVCGSRSSASSSSGSGSVGGPETSPGPADR